MQRGDSLMTAPMNVAEGSDLLFYRQGELAFACGLGCFYIADIEFWFSEICLVG
ncbi:hypothetical protein HED51_08620 [Ochrobactrum grignonense]|nr:hypothetical protein [Brucella grignonensis]